MEGKKIIGPALRDLCFQADLSYEELGRRVHRTAGTLRNLASGCTEPSGRLAYRLARVLGEALGRTVALDEFMEDDEPNGAAA